jgi:acyl dehydratase
MTEETLITPELKAMVGQETDLPGIEAIDRTSIARYAHAISDLDPLYLDEEYAKQTEYGGVVAPPTFLFDIIPASVEVGDDGRDLTRIKLPGYRLARGGNEYQFFRLVRPGDVVNRKRKIIDVYEKESKKVGTMIFVVYDISYTNQEGELLGINRETLMFFK